MSRAGFTWLKQAAPDVYRDWRRFLNLSIDLYDWGWLVDPVSGRKTRANSKHSLNYWLGDQRTGPEPRRPHALSVARLQAATESHEQTVYVCSHPHHRVGVLMVDIDDKQGTYGDAMETCQYVSDLLTERGIIAGGSLYQQPSTFGYGYHGYCHVLYQDHTVREIREMYSGLQHWLIKQVADAGYHSTVEIKGHPGIVTSGRYQTCGQLAKFPRLGRDVQQYRQFLYQTPALNLSALSVITNSLRERREERESQTGQIPTRPVSNTVITNSLREREGGKAQRLNTAAATGGTDGVLASVAAPEQYSARVCHTSTRQPAQRMGDLARAYSRQMGRPVTAAELLAEYERQGLATGEDHDGNRQHLAERNAQWVADNWNQCLATGECFDPTDYSALISRYVTDDIRSRVKTRYTYTDADLAVIIYTVETNSRHTDTRQNGCPVAAFATMAETIGYDWGDSENTIRGRIAAMKRVLLDAELIRELENGRYWFGNGNGRGKKYAVGRNHPDYSGMN